MPIGENLKNARMKKGYSFEFIEEATKIRTKYLQALENEEYDVLPGPVYAKAFLRTYAKFLELNTDEIIEEYNTAKTPPTTPVIENQKDKELQPITEGSGKKWRYLVAGLAVVSLLAFKSWYNTGNRPEDNKPELPKTAQEQQKPNNANTRTPDNKESQQIQGVRVVLKVTNDPSWMQVVADGNTVFSGTVRPGEMKDFQAQEKIFLHVGNAGAVQVNVNGKDLGPLGEKGKVKKIPFNAGEEPMLTQG